MMAEVSLEKLGCNGRMRKGGMVEFWKKMHEPFLHSGGKRAITRQRQCAFEEWGKELKIVRW